MNKKTIIIIGVVVLVLIFGYLYMTGTSTPKTSGNLIPGSDSFGGVGSAELSLLNQMKFFRIDATLFKDPAYLSLLDYSVTISPQGVGRPNPFAPIPGVSNPYTSEASSASTPRTGP